MKTLFFMVACFWAVVLGQLSQEIVPVDDVNKVCVSKDPEVGTLNYGDVITMKKSCVRVTCSPGHIELAGCGKISVTPPCYVGPENLSMPYPHCCPKLECPKGFPKSK